MCGIVGFYSKDNQYTNEHLLAMNDVIAHRGPDASGYFNDKHCYLGHRRLSIIDTSESANQPFYSHCNRYVMVYNGEVYNFKELAAKYKIVAKTSSDTEIVLTLFTKLGVSFVSVLNGMFSITIYDTTEKQLFLFRDRVGIKPLFYYQSEGLFAFASELKSLKKLLNKKLSINKTAVSDFLYLGYIPEPNTIYEEIKKFPSGSYAIVKGGALEIKKYWDNAEKIDAQIISDEHNAKHTLKELLVSSVEYRMISDVPLGTFLSGGTDSSLVTAIAQSISNKPVKTFSIGFKEAKFNEAVHAKTVAKHLNTEHHEFILSEKEAIEQVDKLLNIYDEPFADSSTIPTLLVSEMAKKEVTVTLSGDGGDELFMGYGMYNWANRLSNPLIQTFRKPISYLLSKGDNRKQRAAKVFDYKSNTRLKSHIFSQEQYFFSEKEISKLLIQDSAISIEENYPNLERKLSPREMQAFFDFNTYLKDDLLVKVDRASMFHSLETRVPLLDHRIVEFALNLDESLKIKGDVQKYLLKEVLYDYIPKNIMDRPKWGFGIPLVTWLSKDLKYLIDNYLSKQIVEKYGTVRFENVDAIVKQFINGKTFLFNRIWVLVLLHKWLKDNE